MSLCRKIELVQNVEGRAAKVGHWAHQKTFGEGIQSVPMAAIAASTSDEVKGPTKHTTVSWASKAYANCPLVEIVHLHDCIRGGKMK